MSRKLTSLYDLKLMANSIRQDLIVMLFEAGSGHPGGALGLTEIFTALYFNLLNHDPKKPNWEKRDRLILSNGHVCPVRYAAMAHSGYFPMEELLTLRKINSRLQGHPSRIDLPGLEFSTASLGQGLGAAVGMALAANLKKQSHTIYCITSDGEHDEGSTWEAVMVAAKYKLSNLINIIDYNNVQISGYVSEILPLDSLKRKYLANHWSVLEINGHDFKQIISAVKKAKPINGPVCIIAHTVLGKGVDFMENKPYWHGEAPNKEEMEKAILQLRIAQAKILKSVKRSK